MAQEMQLRSHSMEEMAIAYEEVMKKLDITVRDYMLSDYLIFSNQSLEYVQLLDGNQNQTVKSRKLQLRKNP